jgi:hypothetical protein
MSDVFFIEGNLGDGKSLCAVGKMIDYLRQGRAVATNLDLYPEHFPISKQRRNNWLVYRLPDYPSVTDLLSLGKGYDGNIKRGKSGIIVLDECAHWLNSRDWNDKTRLEMIQFFTHLRKRRWDAAFLIQSAEDIDSQLRRFLMKLKVRCYTSKDFPFIRWFPQFHLASVRRIMSHSDIKVDTWLYSGRSLYKSYDTEQEFDVGYSSGLYSYLSPWHLVGRYRNRFEILQQFLQYLLYATIVLSARISGNTCVNLAKRWGVYKHEKINTNIRPAYIYQSG